jgi:tRNA acetyltransferase TAN1
VYQCLNILQFAVACRVRNCSRLSRMDVINSLASVAGQSHTVDLNEPDLTIIAEVCQVRQEKKKKKKKKRVPRITHPLFSLFCRVFACSLWSRTLTS